MRNIEFVPKAFKEYQEWVQTDRKTALRIGDLIRDILKNPFEGIGKPESLKHQFKDIGVGELIMSIGWYMVLRKIPL